MRFATDPLSAALCSNPNSFCMLFCKILKDKPQGFNNELGLFQDRIYIERMENILNLYERPYRRKDPVICFDKKLHHLVSDVRSPLAMKEGFIKKRDYEYKRKGSCNVFCVIEPRAGHHLI